MRLSTSRVLSFDSKSGLSTSAWPTSASTAVPPRAGFGTVATGWHATSARSAANAASVSLDEMRRHPNVGHRADQEGRDEDPRGPVDLTLEAAPRAITSAQTVAAAANRPAETRRLGCLDQHSGDQEDRKDGLRYDQRVLQLCHGTPRFYRAELGPLR